MSTREIYKLFLSNTSGIATDSRSVRQGDLFFALKGDSFDGNQFAKTALEMGAAAAIIDNSRYQTKGAIIVDNSLNTLQELARIHRSELNIPVLAITGTNGKTTTKELLASVLAKRFKVHYTSGNLNNHIGLPVTILMCPKEAEFMVVEMGANHIGEIETLCKIADPDVGLITNIGKAHLEGFGSFEGVVEAKGELYRYLSDRNGTVLYNDANELLRDMTVRLECKTIPYSKPFGELTIGTISDRDGLSFDINYNGSVERVNSALYGNHNVENILAAVAVGIGYNIELKDIAEAINSYKPDNNRSQLLNTGSNLILCDAYNANPDSMLRSMESFLKSDRKPKAIILGDMLEMGTFADDEHSRIIEYLKKLKDIQIFLVGEIFGRCAVDSGFNLFKNTQLLVDHLERRPIKDSFVLVKGSRGIGLEKSYKVL